MASVHSTVCDDVSVKVLIQSNLALRNFLVTTTKSKVLYFKHLTKVTYRVYLMKNQGKMAYGLGGSQILLALFSVKS